MEDNETRKCVEKLGEAEFRSMASTIAEIVWLKELSKELGVEVKMSIKLFCDNKVVIKIATQLIFYERTKYFDIDCHFVGKKIMDILI